MIAQQAPGHPPGQGGHNGQTGQNRPQPAQALRPPLMVRILHAPPLAPARPALAFASRGPSG